MHGHISDSLNSPLSGGPMSSPLGGPMSSPLGGPMSSPHGMPMSPLSASSKQGTTSPHGITSPLGITPSYQVLSASNPVSSTPQRLDIHDGLGSSSSSVIANGSVIRSPGGLPHSQSGITPTSGAELLKECIEWVENRRVSILCLSSGRSKCSISL